MYCTVHTVILYYTISFINARARLMIIYPELAPNINGKQGAAQFFVSSSNIHEML
jgi:hypothetical protein